MSAVRRSRDRHRTIISDSDSDESSNKDETPPSYPVTLAIGNRVDELAEIIGDVEKPYFDTLGPEDANNTATRPNHLIRELFERYREKRTADVPLTIQKGLSRSQNLSQIKSIRINNITIPTWYSSPYPEEYISREQISICSLCLNYMTSDFVGDRHDLKCQPRMPPGSEIYRDGKYSIFEVDGALASIYCQNLCLLAKLFLDSKALYQDVHPFMFYVLTEVDSTGAHFLGYFSKQKIYASREPAATPTLNVSCIMALPSVQNKGVGQFLIDFSYLLTRRQATVGTPEKPLSKLGLKAYQSYWTRQLCFKVRDAHAQGLAQSLSLESLSETTGITADDLVFAMETLGWITKSNPQSLKIDLTDVEQKISRWEAFDSLRVKPDNLLWLPPSAW